MLDPKETSSPVCTSFQALELLPPDTEIRQIQTFMENVLELQAATKNKCRILRNMLFSESLHVSSNDSLDAGNTHKYNPKNYDDFSVHVILSLRQILLLSQTNVIQ